jgi:lipopolysaccharide transport system permease protein
LKLNPLTGIIQSFRVSLLGIGQFDWQALLISTIMTLALLVYAAFMFRKMEKSFADIV